MSGLFAMRRREMLNEAIESYRAHADCFEVFFTSFSDSSCQGAFGAKKYLNELQKISNGESSTLYVEADDLIKQFKDEQEHTTKGKGLVQGVLTNTKRYLDLMYVAAEKVKNEYTPATSGFAVLLSATTAAMERANVPVSLRVPYEIHIVPPTAMASAASRFINATQVGSLCKIEGVVSRVTPVKPRVQVATYKCHDCGSDLFQSVDGPSFMPLGECSADSCKTKKTRGAPQLMTRECRFIKHQEARIQEPSNLVPPGTIPRTMKVVLLGEMSRRLTPGMSATLGGIMLPVTKTGYAAIRGGLVADTYFEVHNVDVHKKGYNDDYKLTPEESEEFERFVSCPDLYQKLANSIAPSICGHEDVKKALLLQLVGGVTEQFDDSMKIRGDIHILLMGDPGVAKSQMLRQICKIAPRAHFTTGKGSSGVGLTASVSKDPTTGEFTLEGGAIVLSDNGICCIDEFDKMDERDRAAIHEVMEQQTVSISKAGLSTTLNARTCILAAANPVYGRYDLNKSAVANMNLPAALLSRFDLQFLILDRPDMQRDLDLAKHVLHVHQTGAPPSNSDGQKYFDAKLMRKFISKARQFKPRIPNELIPEIVDHYVQLRSSDRRDRERNEAKGYTTPRTLLAILRMSQSLARLRRSNLVHRVDFEEAMRLMQSSKESIITSEDELYAQNQQARLDFRSAIMEYLRDLDIRMSHRGSYTGWLNYLKEITEEVLKMGYTEAQLTLTVDEYVDLDVLVWKNDKHATLAFVDRLELLGRVDGDESSGDEEAEI